MIRSSEQPKSCFSPTLIPGQRNIGEYITTAPNFTNMAREISDKLEREREKFPSTNREYVREHVKIEITH
jgi:hypothetical protein